jgi:hypothetical protein
MYERLGSRPIPRRVFVRRLAAHFALAGALVLGSLAAGMAGYMYFECLPWRDAFVNAAMLLGGMGPVDPLVTPLGKVFAGLYALYAGLIFLVVAAIVLAPLVHRFLHRLHWDEDDAPRA